MKRRIACLVAAGVFLSVASTAATAQVLSGGTPPIENSGNAAARSPGRMVGDSIARQQEVLVGPIPNWDNITEEGEPGVPTPFLSQAMLLLAQQLTLVIDLFVDALLIRAGIEPVAAIGDSGSGGGRDTGSGRDGGKKAIPAESPLKLSPAADRLNRK